MAEKKTDAELQIEAARALLSSGIKFTIENIGELEVKPLTLRTLIQINEESATIQRFEKEPTKVYEIIDRASDSIPAAKIIAIAILQKAETKKERVKTIIPGIYRTIKKTKDKQIEELQQKIINNLSAIELKQLTDVVMSQTNADFFLNSISQLGALRILAPATKVVTVSGEPLQE
jgi:DNA uptake protein ComE-like DNA-binding protein